MILPQNYTATMTLMLLSMLCLGVWVSALRLAGKWRFELFYFDFAFGLLIASVIYAFTVGDMGYDGFSFLDDLQHAGKRQWLFCLAAGMIFNFANILLVAAVSVGGMVAAFPIAMGTALVLGTALGFVTTRAANTMMLLLGCAMLLTAVVVNAMAYRLLAVQRHEVLARAGKARSTRRPTSFKGIVLSVVSGLIMGSFALLLDKARQGDLGLGPYAIGAIFAFGVFFSTFVYNMFFMNLPVEGEPVEISSYFSGRPKQHIFGLLGGIVWFTGTMAGLVALSAPEGAQPSLATRALLGQAAPLLTVLMGILVWKELKGADMRVKSLTLLMLVLYGCGVVLVSVAPLYVRNL
jgi:glucose uptake protein